MIDLSTLEDAFADIARLGTTEDTFLIDDVPITVRPLKDKENIQLWKYASVALEGGDDAASQQEWMHRMKVATLAFGIVQVGSLDLRDGYIETGERLESGKPIRREKFEVVRELLAKWPSALLLRVFARYGEFITRVELEAEAAVELHPVDIASEIKRLQERIADLEKQQKKADLAKVDPMGKRIQETLGFSNAEREHSGKLAQQAQQVIYRKSAEQQPQNPAYYAQSLETDSALQESEPEVPPRYTREQVQEALARKSTIDPESSFIDPTDQDTIDAVQHQQVKLLEERNARLLAERNAKILAEQAAQAEAFAQKESMREQRLRVQEERRREAIPSQSVTSGRRPAHLAAARAAAQAAQVGIISQKGEEVPVYQLPPQILSPRKAPVDVEKEPTVNQPSVGATNPKFKPPRG